MGLVRVKGGLEGGQTQGRYVWIWMAMILRNIPVHLYQLYQLHSRLGLLNQQMAGLASSLSGKTGTFQVSYFLSKFTADTDLFDDRLW